MNRRHLFTISTAALLPLICSARSVNLNEARQLASDFFAKSGIEAHISEPSRQIKSTATAQLPYYVFNADSDRGFVIIAGDDRLGSVLGYADSGNFSLEGAPEGLIALMNLYEQYMSQSSSADNTTPQAAGTPVVNPLLSDIAWGQDSPFNSLCPTYSSGTSSTHYYTGCVVTAATQIMKFYNFPQQGTGKKSYQFGTQTLSADFANTTYSWDEMAPAVPDSPSTSQTLAYSTLAYHFGVAVEMQYAKDGSGAYTMMVPTALKDYFGYDKALRIHTREYYTSKEWMDMIKAELEAGRPVYYGASSDVGNGGHAFVCDGYDSNDYVHINWGWYGRSNGYFLVNHLNPSSLGEGGGTGGYNRSQEIITGIRPAAENSAKAYSLYGATRLSCVDYVGSISLMSYIENLDTEAVTGQIGALLVKDGNIVKVLGTQEASINGFAAGRTGSISAYMRNVPTNVAGIPEGDGYIIKMGFLPQGETEWVVLRHPIGLPSYINASVQNGIVIVGDSHQPTPDVLLLSPLSVDGDLYANCSAVVRFNIENRSADCRLKSITVRLTSVDNPEQSYEMSAAVNIYDLSTEEFDLRLQLPEAIPAGEYQLTAYETSYPDAPFDNSNTGVTVVNVLDEPAAPVLRLTGSPVWSSESGESESTHGLNFSIIAPVRNYGAAGTASVVARLTDTQNPDHSYIFIQQDQTFTKGQDANIIFMRKMIADPGTYTVDLSVIDSEGNESLLQAFAEPVTVTVTDAGVSALEAVSLTLPENLVKGSSTPISLKLRALNDFYGTVYVRIRQFTNKSGEIVSMKSGVRLSAGDETDITANYRPGVAQGRYMAIVEARPSTASMGNEIPVRGLPAYYREIYVTDLAGIGNVAADSGHGITISIDGNSVEVSADSDIKSLSIYSTAGQLLNRSEADRVISTECLVPGIYILKVVTEKATEAIKFKK